MLTILIIVVLLMNTREVNEMTKMNKMIDNLHIALAKVEETKAIMMDTNTSSIFWNEIDAIESKLRVNIELLGEIESDSE